MPPDPSRDSPHPRAEQTLRDLRQLIDEHGWAVRNVLPGPTDTDVCFSYTVGLTAMGHPEIVVMGMPHEHAHTFLDLIGDEVRAGTRYEHGTVTGEFTDENSPVVFIRADDTSQLTAVEQVYGGVYALQMVWPDSTGRLPWHEGYRNPPTAQPLLGAVPGV